MARLVAAAQTPPAIMAKPSAHGKTDRFWSAPATPHSAASLRTSLRPVGPHKPYPIDFRTASGDLRFKKADRFWSAPPAQVHPAFLGLFGGYVRRSEVTVSKGGQIPSKPLESPNLPLDSPLAMSFGGRIQFLTMKLRPMSCRWIWLVPSQIWVILASRISRSTRMSLQYPYPPKSCTASVAMRIARSDARILRMEASIPKSTAPRSIILPTVQSQLSVSTSS